MIDPLTLEVFWSRLIATVNEQATSLMRTAFSPTVAEAGDLSACVFDPRGFMIAQARLGPGRIHHCMRAIGVAERALALMTERARTRIAFGKPLAEQGMVQQQIALSRNEIDQARLLCEKAAWTIDEHGNRAAFSLVSQIKAVAPQMACTVIDRAIQVHGGGGVSDDFPLARMYGWHRAMRIFDGPDEVHIRTVARAEIGREKSALAAAVTGG